MGAQPYIVVSRPTLQLTMIGKIMRPNQPDGHVTHRAYTLPKGWDGGRSQSASLNEKPLHSGFWFRRSTSAPKLGLSWSGPRTDTQTTRTSLAIWFPGFSCTRDISTLTQLSTQYLRLLLQSPTRQDEADSLQSPPSQRE